MDEVETMVAEQAEWRIVRVVTHSIRIDGQHAGTVYPGAEPFRSRVCILADATRGADLSGRMMRDSGVGWHAEGLSESEALDVARWACRVICAQPKVEVAT